MEVAYAILATWIEGQLIVLSRNIGKELPHRTDNMTAVDQSYHEKPEQIHERCNGSASEQTHRKGCVLEPPPQPRDATEEEIESFPHVVDRVPWAAWIVIFAGAAERFTYFGVLAPWRGFTSCLSPIY